MTFFLTDRSCEATTRRNLASGLAEIVLTACSWNRAFMRIAAYGRFGHSVTPFSVRRVNPRASTHRDGTPGSVLSHPGFRMIAASEDRLRATLTTTTVRDAHPGKATRRVDLSNRTRLASGSFQVPSSAIAGGLLVAVFLHTMPLIPMCIQRSPRPRVVKRLWASALPWLGFAMGRFGFGPPSNAKFSKIPSR